MKNKKGINHGHYSHSAALSPSCEDCQKPSHTPAPWALVIGEKRELDVYAYPPASDIDSHDGNGVRIACIFYSTHRAEANGRLLAAAPELLDALILAHNELALLRDQLRFPRETMSRIEAAIAKAEGRK